MATLKSCEKCGRTFADGGLWTAGTRTMCEWCEKGIDPWPEYTAFEKSMENNPDAQRMAKQLAEAFDKIAEDKKIRNKYIVKES